MQRDTFNATKTTVSEPMHLIIEVGCRNARFVDTSHNQSNNEDSRIYLFPFFHQTLHTSYYSSPCYTPMSVFASQISFNWVV